MELVVWGQNIKFIPIVLLLTSHFMFWTYRGLTKRWCGCVVGGGGGSARRVVVAYSHSSMHALL